MPVVLNCRGDSGCAAWKNHGLGCEYVAPFPVFSEIFWDFLPFGKGIPVGISRRDEEKGCQIYFFSSSDWHENGHIREILVLWMT